NHAGRLSVIPESDATDPQLLLALEGPLVISAAKQSWMTVLMGAGMLTAWCWLGAAVLRRTPLQWLVTGGLGAALVLIVSMNAISGEHLNLHPDEAPHAACVSHFLEHFWPPAAGDPGIVPSLKASPWGIS